MRRRARAIALGAVLTTASAVLVLALASLTIELIEVRELQCKAVCDLESATTCPHPGSIPLESYIGFTAGFLVLGVGIYTMLRGGLPDLEVARRRARFEKVMHTLKEDEREVCHLIRQAGGVIFQSELVKQTGFSKAKVSRILDKLEAIGLIERRRRGMTNVVVWKGE